MEEATELARAEVFDSMRPTHPNVPTVGGTPGVGCLIMAAPKP